MKRRNAIKSLSASVGALLVIPAWANGWTLQSVSTTATLFDESQLKLLSEIVTTIIPEGAAPGAKSLGVDLFIQKLVVDCYEPKAQDEFKNGLESIEKFTKQSFNQSFPELSSIQKLELFKLISNSTDIKLKEFYNQIKNLTIQGYTTTEYVMVNHYKYEMAPGHYYGCVPV